MSRITYAATYSSVSAIVAAIVLTVTRSLLGNPIEITEMLIVGVLIWTVNFVTQLVLRREN